METPIQPSPGMTSSTNSLVPQNPSQADPGVIKVMQAIKNVETPGEKDPYNAVGDNGQSHGAFQFNKDNYKNWASQYGLDPNDFSTAGQNKVAYAHIKDLKNQGLGPEEIAAKWNGAKMVNGKYTYVNPEYGVKFRAALQGQPTSIGQSQGQNPLGATSAEASNGQKPDENQSILGKLFDFAFPIVGDIGADIQGKGTKSALQQLGDAGLSALWFAPGVGEGAEAAIRGAGLLGKTGAKIAGHAIGGATTGYASDVGSKLSSGDTNAADILTPGAGTLTGGLAGGILGKVGSKYAKHGILDSVGEKNNSVIGQTKRGANELAESFSKDKNPGALLAQKGINIPATVNPETVAYETASHAEGLRNDANVLTDTLTKALEKVPGSTQASSLEEQLINKINAQAPDKITAAEQAQIVQEEFKKIRAQYGESLSAADINALKKRAWNLSKFDMAVPNTVRKTQRLLGNNLKTTVEDMAKKVATPENGLGEIGDFNDYIGQHLDAADHLDRIHGQKAPGGRLGDLLKSHAMAEIGGIGGLFGGGPVGALAGALAGHYGGKLVGAGIRKLASSPLKNAILNRMIQEDPEIVQKITAYAKQTPQGLEAIKQHLGQQGIKIFEGPKNKVKIPPKQPGLLARIAKKSAKSGLIGTASRVGSQFNSPTQSPSK